MKRAARRALLVSVCAGVSLFGAPSRGDALDADVAVVEITAYLQARPAFERNCFRCHSGNSDEFSRKAIEALDMSRYPFSGRRAATAGRMVRKTLDGASGKRTMPKDDPESMTADDVALVLKWAEVFDTARVKKN